jgi:hypothetical protein
MSSELQRLLEHAVKSQSTEGTAISSVDDVTNLIQESWALVSKWYLNSGVDFKGLLESIKSRASGMGASSVAPLVRSCMYGEMKAFEDFAGMLMTEEQVKQVLEGLDPSIVGLLDSAVAKASENLKSSQFRKRAKELIGSCSAEFLVGLVESYEPSEEDHGQVCAIMRAMGFGEDEFTVPKVKDAIRTKICVHEDLLNTVRRYAAVVVQSADASAEEMKKAEKAAKKAKKVARRKK